MARKQFIFQGFTSRTQGDAVRRLFEVSKVQRVVLSVAFVTESGVDLIKHQLEANAAKTMVIAGIRNDITSRQGLGSLLSLGVRLYTVDTGSRNLVFHPKLYLVRGDVRARLLVGSANLTLGGLNNNIEAGISLDFDLSDPDDNAIVGEIEHELDVLPATYPEHVVLVDASAKLDDLLSSGRLVDEQALPAPKPSTASSIPESDGVSRIKLKVPLLRKPLATIKTKRVGATAVLAPVVGVESVLMWESKPLTRRDLVIPTASGTHATGSINLDKGLLGSDVDHRHYFRDAVFDHLTWVPAGSTVDEAHAKFHLIVKGISYGEFDLRIAHTTSTSSRSYLQNNAMTRLSWGPMRPFVARPDLINRTLALYRDGADPTRFVLEID
jgi:HKD family nuclease